MQVRPLADDPRDVQVRPLAVDPLDGATCTGLQRIDLQQREQVSDAGLRPSSTVSCHGPVAECSTGSCHGPVWAPGDPIDIDEWLDTCDRLRRLVGGTQLGVLDEVRRLVVGVHGGGGAA